MKKIKALALALCLGIIMVGCNNTQKGATIGTAGGAVLGAIIGKIAGNAGVGAAIGGAVGAGTGAIIGNRMDKVKKQAEAVQNAQVQQVTDANGLQAVKVTFDSGILFPTSSSTLQASAQSSLIQFAYVPKQNTDADVAIQGYTDNDPWKGSTAEQSVQKNLNLSQQRAQSVSTFLIGQGVSGTQIKSVQGFGEQNPVADNSTAAGKAQNRRVEIYLYASQAMINAANNGTLK